MDTLEVNKLDIMPTNRSMKFEKSFVSSLIRGKLESGNSSVIRRKHGSVYLPPVSIPTLDRENTGDQGGIRMSKSIISQLHSDVRSSFLSSRQMSHDLLYNESNSKRYADFLKPESNPKKAKSFKIRLKRSQKSKIFKMKQRMQQNSGVFDHKLTKTPQSGNKSRNGFRDYYSYLTKTKDEIQLEKLQRLQMFKKRKHDASTALLKHMGHKIESSSRRVVVSKRGVSTGH